MNALPKAIPGRKSEVFLDKEPVTIVIPTHNRRDLVYEAILSVQAQTHEQWKLIVVDDHSSDGTIEYLDETIEDPRISIVPLTEGRGGQKARNLGLELSKSEYVVFLDSDDMLAPDCLERRLTEIRKSPDLDFVVFQAGLFDDVPGDTDLMWNYDSGEDVLERMLRMDQPWQTNCFLWKRESLVRIGAWDETLRRAQDLELQIRAVARGLSWKWFPVIDCFVRQPSKDRVSIGSTIGQLDEKLTHLDRIDRTQEVLEASGLFSGDHRTLLAGNYFWLSTGLASTYGRRHALNVWKRGWEYGVLEPDKFFPGLGYLVFQGTAFEHPFVYWIGKYWPNQMFAFIRPFFKKTPRSYNQKFGELLTRDINPFSSIRMVQDGPIKFLFSKLSRAFSRGPKSPPSGSQPR
ncbi:glycosyltransferase family 2 protein [Haloferula chungangensis]|uniref:Glycosyltransferase family 2 protein n=1 Tax=Haloferula chungangensis TaxID=1048331 RepID=A0ABW2L9Y3_9BACT